jgi:hypothetical protein
MNEKCSLPPLRNGTEGSARLTAMNRVSKSKLEKLVARCEDALRNKAQQSIYLWRGEMWAVVAAAHELRKRGLLSVPPAIGEAQSVPSQVAIDEPRKS